MFKLIKTATYVSYGLAFAALVFAVFFGLKKDKNLQKILLQPSVVEKFKKSAGNRAGASDKQSPLVAQARLFALRIDPPPPPVETRPSGNRDNRPAANTTELEPPRPTFSSAKFKVVATAKYENHPEKSLVLLDIPAEGLKWYRHGQQVGHGTIQEIHEGSIVYGTGDNTQQLYASLTNSVPSLLKSDAGSSPVQSAPQLLPGVSNSIPHNTNTGHNESSTRTFTPPGKQSVETQRTTPRTRTRTSRTRRTAPVVKPPVIVTPEDQKESIDDTISNLEKMMNEMEKTSTSSEDMENMNKLLKMLEEEKATLENTKNKDLEDPKRK